MMEGASGDLAAVVKKKTASKAVRARLFVEMVKGIGVMHDAGYIHRDLKPANVLITGDCGSAASCHAKVADLGLSCSHSGKISKCSGIGGTPLYLAPETVRLSKTRGMQFTDGVHEKNDVWALGLIFYEMLFGRLPASIAGSSSMAALERNIMAFSIVSDSGYMTLTQAEKELFKNMLALNPKERWSSQVALSKAQAVAVQLGADMSQLSSSSTKLPECWYGAAKAPDLAPPPQQPAQRPAQPPQQPPVQPRPPQPPVQHQPTKP